MPRNHPSIEVLMQRFDREVSALFYEVFLTQVIATLGQPSVAEIRAELAKLQNGNFVRSEASDKQLLGRMDTTFGLLDCVGGSGLEKRFRLNEKGKALLKQTTVQIIQPLLSTLETLPK